MKHRVAVAAGAAWLLAGCTGQSEGFEHLLAQARNDNVEAQITLAHAYADPARFPGRGPTRPDGREAAMWCYVAVAKHPAVADKACADVLTTTSPQDRAWGLGEADDWMQGPDSPESD
jgi:hypothetical protein